MATMRTMTMTRTTARRPAMTGAKMTMTMLLMTTMRTAMTRSMVEARLPVKKNTEKRNPTVQCKCTNIGRWTDCNLGTKPRLGEERNNGLVPNQGRTRAGSRMGVESEAIHPSTNNTKPTHEVIVRTEDKYASGAERGQVRSVIENVRVSFTTICLHNLATNLHEGVQRRRRGRLCEDNRVRRS